MKRTRNGVPLDAADWTVDDWRDLHRSLQRLKRRVAERHRHTEKAMNSEEELARYLDDTTPPAIREAAKVAADIAKAIADRDEKPAKGEEKSRTTSVSPWPPPAPSPA